MVFSIPLGAKPVLPSSFLTDFNDPKKKAGRFTRWNDGLDGFPLRGNQMALSYLRIKENNTDGLKKRTEVLVRRKVLDLVLKV
jgi:hypothetical protein